MFLQLLPIAVCRFKAQPGDVDAGSLRGDYRDQAWSPPGTARSGTWRASTAYPPALIDPNVRPTGRKSCVAALFINARARKAATCHR